MILQEFCSPLCPIILKKKKSIIFQQSTEDFFKLMFWKDVKHLKGIKHKNKKYYFTNIIELKDMANTLNDNDEELRGVLYYDKNGDNPIAIAEIYIKNLKHYCRVFSFTKAYGNYIDLSASKFIGELIRFCKEGNIWYSIDTLNNKEIFSKKNEIKTDTECPICLINDDKPYIKLKCSHSFHTDCVKEWFDKDKLTCPYCRTQLN